MRWSGETRYQWFDRCRKWHRRYCWLPQQSDEGTWVWLDYIWARIQPNLRGGFYWEYSSGDRPPRDIVTTMPPPKPKK